MDAEQIRRLAATLRNMGWLVPVGAIQSALHAEKLCLVNADAEIARLRSALTELAEMTAIEDGFNPRTMRRIAQDALAPGSPA
jgi:hypothetical protein